jgi:kynureninase
MINRTDFPATEEFALELDRTDPLKDYRSRFHLPETREGTKAIYLAGNSLGLAPRDAKGIVERELEAWARLGVDGHFDSATPWYSYHEIFRAPLSRLVGASPGEVVLMNSLTVNLHLMMITFYRPTPDRYKILIDQPTFPSDMYAVKSQAAFHGFDPEDAIVLASPRPGEETLRMEDLEALLEQEGPRTALVLMSGVNFYTGQAFDIETITRMARSQGCRVGWDLAHAAGNVILKLHDWDVDFAAWCSYKYLNGGPGAVGGCFVHEGHAEETDLPRLSGWWGNDPATRFRMHLLPDFIPRPGADGWQVSNPPILAMAPLRASLALFDEAGMAAVRTKSETLTAYLEFLIDQTGTSRFEIATPKDPGSRGAQLSIFVHGQPRELFRKLKEKGVVADVREPNVVRVAPVPLYNSFHDVWRFSQILLES